MLTARDASVVSEFTISAIPESSLFGARGMSLFQEEAQSCTFDKTQWERTRFAAEAVNDKKSAEPENKGNPSATAHPEEQDYSSGFCSANEGRDDAQGIRAPWWIETKCGRQRRVSHEEAHAYYCCTVHRTREFLDVVRALHTVRGSRSTFAVNSSATLVYIGCCSLMIYLRL